MTLVHPLTAEDVRVLSGTEATPGPEDQPVERQPRKRGRKPKAPEPAEPKQVIEWGMLAAYLHPLSVGVFTRYGADPPQFEATRAVCMAWGSVAEKYLPNLAGYEVEVTAALVTLGYAGPILQVILYPPKSKPSPPPGPDNGKPTGN